jgi:hypothetical protein
MGSGEGGNLPRLSLQKMKLKNTSNSNTRNSENILKNMLCSPGYCGAISEFSLKRFNCQCQI